MSEKFLARLTCRTSLGDAIPIACLLGLAACAPPTHPLAELQSRSPQSTRASSLPAIAAKSAEYPGTYTWNVGFNETIIDGYIKYRENLPPDPASNIPARSLATFNGLLYDLTANRHVGAHREILPMADIEPTYLSQANYPWIEDVIASYAAVNSTLILALGLPLPPWMSSISTECIMPADPAAWQALKDAMGLSAGRLMQYLWNSQKISRNWLGSKFYLEGFNEFDNVFTLGCQDHSHSTPKRAADLQNGIQAVLNGSGIPIQTLMPSIVGANPSLYPGASSPGQAMGEFIQDYYNKYYGTGLPDIHYYSQQTTASGYVSDVAGGVGVIASYLPARLQGQLVLGETGGPAWASDCPNGLVPGERNPLLAAIASNSVIQSDVAILAFWRLMDLPAGYIAGCEAHYGSTTWDGSAYHGSALALFGFLGGDSATQATGVPPQAASSVTVTPPPSTTPPPPPPVATSYQVVGKDPSGNIVNLQTTFTVLDGFQGSCDQNAPESPACSSAVDRFCLANGWGGGGYGPVEYNGNALAAVCFSASAESLVLTSFSQARAVQPACTPGTPYGAGCTSAANRLCVAGGSAAGFGPVEYDANNLYISCMSPSYTDYILGTFSELRTFHPGCDSAAVSISGACNAAINRDCAARGYVGGIGVLEYDGDNAAFACFR